MALKLDNNLLEELGLGALPEHEKQLLLRQIYEKLEMNVGVRLADQMSNEQLDEFEKFVDANDDKGAFQWLESNFPNYKDVVNQEFEKLKAEIRQYAPQMLAVAAQNAGAAPQQPQTQAAGPAPQQPQFNAPQAQFQPAPQQPYQPHSPPPQQPEPNMGGTGYPQPSYGPPQVSPDPGAPAGPYPAQNPPQPQYGQPAPQQPYQPPFPGGPSVPGYPSQQPPAGPGV